MIRRRLFAAAFCLGIVLGGVALDAIDPPDDTVYLHIDTRP